VIHHGNPTKSSIDGKPKSSSADDGMEAENVVPSVGCSYHETCVSTSSCMVDDGIPIDNAMPNIFSAYRDYTTKSSVDGHAMSSSADDGKATENVVPSVSCSYHETRDSTSSCMADDGIPIDNVLPNIISAYREYTTKSSADGNAKISSSDDGMATENVVPNVSCSYHEYAAATKSPIPDYTNSCSTDDEIYCVENSKNDSSTNLSGYPVPVS